MLTAALTRAPGGSPEERAHRRDDCTSEDPFGAACDDRPTPRLRGAEGAARLPDTICSRSASLSRSMFSSDTDEPRDPTDIEQFRAAPSSRISPSMRITRMSRPVEPLLERLQGIRRTRRGARALCPSHRDMHPSLDISEGADGRALIVCRAGCRTSDVLSDLGLRWSDLFVTGEVRTLPYPPRALNEDDVARRNVLPKRAASRCASTSSSTPIATPSGHATA